MPRPGRQQLRWVELATGAVQTGFEFNGDGVSAVLSPDGRRLAYGARVAGRMGYGVFSAGLDGSDPELIAQLDHWSVSNPVWSPDGRWLMVSVLDTDAFIAVPRPALIGLEGCAVYALSGLEGDVQGWVP